METSGEDDKGRKRKISKGENCGGESGDHEVHILTERERRKKMRNMFSGLHDLLPHLPPKADKSTIVDEAIKCIKDLQETLVTLEKQKQQKHQLGASVTDSDPSVITSPAEAIESGEPFLGVQDTFSVDTPTFFQTWLSPNVVMNMCGNDAHINVCSVKKPGLLTSMFYILQKHKLDVVSAHVSSDQFRCVYMFHVHAGEGSGKYAEGFSVEDLFKLAAGEMNLWLLSC
ncbi:basic helix-loop-helix (bHLH) DNA-binding superfamily protein [Euphorbia peplus]|nr:basic helix-loop-helix (bHLH) DNA-binding superfamily protein [Euphorbia peplus]